MPRSNVGHCWWNGLSQEFVMLSISLTRWIVGFTCWMMVATLISQSVFAADDDAAVARARKQVQMLDDLYKTAVVLITEHYVKKDSDTSAGSAAKLLFEAMKKKGHHEARLVDATGNPYLETNAPSDAFEKEAIAAIKSGKPYFDKVETKGGKKVLRAATIIPVVMQKCTMCHPHYEKAKPGEAIGSLMFIMPIE
jgi:hypothetical protein